MRRGKATLPGKATVTYPHWMRLGHVLELQDPHSGRRKEKMEFLYLSQGAGNPEITGVAPLPGIDVENLSEEEINDLVTNWASGHKIKFFLDRDTGKEEPHVLMHSLTPVPNPARAAVKETDDSPSGERTEVNIC